MEQHISPAITGARYSCCSVGLPKRQRGGGHVGHDAHAHGNAAAQAVAERLREQHLEAVVEPLAAHAFGLVDAQETEPSHLAEHLVRRPDAVLLPLRDVGVELFLDESLHRPVQLLVLVGKNHYRLRFEKTKAGI
jgi:hypothetical protein